MSSEPPSPDAVLHLATLHVLAATGFASTSQAASLTVSSALSKYLRLVARSCTDRANLAGRSKVAAIDVFEALEDLGVGGVGELYEWTVGLDSEVTFRDAGLAGLERELTEGRQEKVIAETRLVPEEELPEFSDDEEDEVKGEDGMDIDFKPLEFPSPDLSWLPPLPGSEGEENTEKHGTKEHHHTLADSSNLSIAERYRRKIPYNQSTLASSREYVEPSTAYPTLQLPPTPTSFPSLLKTYAETAGEPSIALRQTHLRRQATEILRRVVASPEEYSPQDTLTSPIPAPRLTPIIPSHSQTNTVQPHFIPLNPDPQGGMLSSLVHYMNTPHLPPTLRERLTSVRPPIALTKDGSKDGEPVLYGPMIRGPGEAALLRAKGKPMEDGVDEGLLRSTWDSGPKGMDKWGKGRIPTGKKVVQSGVGEPKPREPPGRRQEHLVPPTPLATPGEGSGRIRLRLSTGDGGISPGSNPMSSANTNGANRTSPLPTPSGGIKIKLSTSNPNSRRSSMDLSQRPVPKLEPINTDVGQSAKSSGTHPALQLNGEENSVLSPAIEASQRLAAIQGGDGFMNGNSHSTQLGEDGSGDQGTTLKLGDHISPVNGDSQQAKDGFDSALAAQNQPSPTQPIKSVQLDDNIRSDPLQTEILSEDFAGTSKTVMNHEGEVKMENGVDDH